MTQRLVTLIVDNVGSKDLIRQKGSLHRLMVLASTSISVSKFSDRDADRLEGLLNFLDACTDQIKDGKAIITGEGPENWEDK